MGLRSWMVAITALLTGTVAMADNGYPPRTGGNYSGPRWYGYFGNNGAVPANADHTNITEIWATYFETPYPPDDTARATQITSATNHILDGLAEAARYGERAMVAVDSIVLIPIGSTGNICYQGDPNAVADFQGLVQTLISNGYLVPNHPESGTVSSFYVADEPDGNCLADSPFAPYTASPNLVNAISAIRQNPNTTNFPLATIVTKDKYGYMPEGISLFDWVGEDDYGNDVGTYLTDFAAFEYIARHNDWAGGTPQLYFLVPAVSSGAGSAGPYTNGAPYLYNEFVADNRVIGIMPFKWDFHGGGMVGMWWAPSYIALGKSIAPGGSPTDITVIIDNLLAN